MLEKRFKEAASGQLVTIKYDPEERATWINGVRAERDEEMESAQLLGDGDNAIFTVPMIHRLGKAEIKGRSRVERVILIPREEWEAFVASGL